MKRILIFILVFVFMFSSLSVASADWNWADVSETAQKAFSGRFVTLEDVKAEIWVPDFLKAILLTDEDLENNCIAAFSPDDESSLVYITYLDMSGLSLEAYRRYLATTGVTANEQTINGIPALVHYNANGDMLVVTFETDEGYFLQAMFYPFSDEDFSVLSVVMARSIQPIMDSPEDAAPVVPTNPVSGLITK